ncbi:TPA: UV DNA damage repair endonuclease UvsE [Candidatus Berkelbacteria bacterium]|nr:UV DNA damage repair endonuclease UvsE [Candidatus Berkelbacteria bacterium]
MRIGYVGNNLTLGCTSSSTFRLASYSDVRLIQTVASNLECLQKIQDFNAENKIELFRISSDLIPFASHEVLSFLWQEHFRSDFAKIGQFAEENNMRLTMHPDQFVILNSQNNALTQKSILELNYHAEVLDLLGTDSSSKIQIHIGGGYGDKKASMNRFMENYKQLPEKIKRRLIIENDDRIFTAKDCLSVSSKTGIPIVLDYFHQALNNDGEEFIEVLNQAAKTWKPSDGFPMLDYSSQNINKRRGSHAETLDSEDFKIFLEKLTGNFDVTIEIKDKEISALKANLILKRFKKAAC